jgi:hypothetical protein
MGRISAVDKPKIALDPFYDNEEDNFSPSQAPGVAAYGKVYGDPSQERLHNGAPITTMVSQGPRGLGMGVLIPHATAGGVPEGLDPNNIADIEVNIDPHMPGQSARIKLCDLHGNLLRQSIAEAQDLVPGAQKIERRRFRASTALRLAAGHVAADDVPRTDPEDGEHEQPMRHGATRQAIPMTPQIRESVPVRSFTQLPAAPQSTVATSTPVSFGPPPLEQKMAASPGPSRGGWLNSFSTPAAPPSTGDVAPPPQLQPANTVQPPTRVTEFEIQHFGFIKAYYHDIQYDAEKGTIMLVYDERYQGPKWFPPQASPGQSPPEMAFTDLTSPAMAGVVCLVTHSGMQYVYEQKAFCLLNVKQVGRLPE